MMTFTYSFWVAPVMQLKWIYFGFAVILKDIICLFYFSFLLPAMHLAKPVILKGLFRHY